MRQRDGTGARHRVVLKIGTSSLVTEGRIDAAKLDRLGGTIAGGLAQGLSPVLVASGAIAVGRTRHDALAGAAPAARQAAAAVGQGALEGGGGTARRAAARRRDRARAA